MEKKNQEKTVLRLFDMTKIKQNVFVNRLKSEISRTFRNFCLLISVEMQIF